MKTSCKKCGKDYFFDDSRIPEGGFTYKCPRCGNGVPFVKDDGIGEQTAGSGTNPVVTGAYAGALGGLGCALPLIAMMMLGIGFLSLGMNVPGYGAAAAILIVLLKMLSAGVLIGISLAFIGAKTEINVWSFPGAFIGAFIGGAIGLISGLFLGTGIGGVFGTALIFGSVVGWVVKAVLVSAVVILFRNFVLSSGDEGPLSAPLSAKQMTTVGLLFFLMVFTIVMDMKAQHSVRAAIAETRQGLSAEGLRVADQQSSLNDQGDLVVSGKVMNNSKDDKMGWLLIAEMRDESGAVLKKAMMMNGIQMHSMRDAEIFRKRNQSVPRPEPGDPKTAPLIKSGESVPFELTFLEPPKEYKEVSFVLKNVDGQSMKEMLSETLAGIKDIKGQEATGN